MPSKPKKAPKVRRIVILSDGETWEELEDNQEPTVVQVTEAEWRRLRNGDHPRHIQRIRDACFQGQAEDE